MGDIDPGGTVDFDFEGSLELAKQLWSLAEELEHEDRGRGRQGETASRSGVGPTPPSSPSAGPPRRPRR